MSSITEASFACRASEPLETGWLAVWLAAESRSPGWSAPFCPAQIALQFGLDGVGLRRQPGAAEPSGGAFDGLGERRLVLGELLQDEKLRIDDHHRIDTRWSPDRP